MAAGWLRSWRRAKPLAFVVLSRLQQHEHSSSVQGWVPATVAVAAVTAAGWMLTKPISCEPSATDARSKRWQQDYLGHYENRLRAYSHPQKVFNYFASIKRDGESFMHPIDFIMSILPYTPGSKEDVSPNTIRQRIQQKCPSAIEFFRLADANGDGLISYQEYIFFLMLLATPESHFRVVFQMFDEDGNGVIDAKEFQHMMNFVSSGVKQRMGSREKAHQLSRRGGLVNLFFGKDGNGSCSYETFSAFLRRLHTEVLHLEFYSNQVDQNDTISAQDFARAVISYANRLELIEYSKRVDTLPQTSERVTFSQFVMLDQIVSNLENLRFALQLYSEANTLPKDEQKNPQTGGFTKEDLKRAVRAAANVELPDFIVAILFHLFDANQDGTLDDDEFIEVLQGRFVRGLNNPRDLGVTKLFQSIINCWTETK